METDMKRHMETETELDVGMGMETEIRMSMETNMEMGMEIEMESKNDMEKACEMQHTKKQFGKPPHTREQIPQHTHRVLQHIPGFSNTRFWRADITGSLQPLLRTPIHCVHYWGKTCFIENLIT